MLYNNDEVEIRSHFTAWHLVNKEQARRYVEHKLENMPAIKQELRAAYIDANYLRGITVAELLEERTT